MLRNYTLVTNDVDLAKLSDREGQQEVESGEKGKKRRVAAALGRAVGEGKQVCLASAVGRGGGSGPGGLLLLLLHKPGPLPVQCSISCQETPDQEGSRNYETNITQVF